MKDDKISSFHLCSTSPEQEDLVTSSRNPQIPGLEQALIPNHRVALTPAVDHVVLVGSVQRPAVVLAVVQVVPATRRTDAANTHLEMIQHTHPWGGSNEQNDRTIIHS